MSSTSGRAIAVGLRDRWWAIPLFIAVASRAWGSALVVILGTPTWPRFVEPPAVGPATLWDGAWFLEVARYGYHAAPVVEGVGGGFHDFAFWPAWPALLGGFLRILSFPPDLVAGLIANGLAVIAIVLWARVLERAFDRSAAHYAVALVAFSPSAFVLSMAYSEPLFLVVGALFFLSAEGGRARPLLAVAAQATRLTGFALGATALPRLWRSGGRDIGAWLTLAAPAAVFATWWVVIAVLTGNPAGYLAGSPAWLARTAATGGPLSFLIGFELGGVWLVPLAISALFAALIVAGTLVLVRNGRWEFACYVAVAAIPSLTLASWEWMPRHLLVAVPAAAVIMAALTTRRRRQLLLLSFGAEIIYALFVLGGRFAP